MGRPWRLAPLFLDCRRLFLLFQLLYYTVRTLPRPIRPLPRQFGSGKVQGVKEGAESLLNGECVGKAGGVHKISDIRCKLDFLFLVSHRPLDGFRKPNL